MKKRIFIAVDINDEARRRAFAYIEALRTEFPRLRVGWEKSEKLHLTMKFLGETGERQLADLQKVVAQMANDITSFNLEIAETGVFPAARNARVLWLGIRDKKGSLVQINDLLETHCERFGFAREQRIFKPHLTIARLKEPQKSKELAEKHLANGFEPVKFSVSEIVIYESKLQPTGSIYVKIDGLKLAG